jgi:hypothetical protein
LSQPPGARIYQVGGGARFVQIGAALAAWRQDAPVDAVIEIVDSHVYVEPVAVELAEGQTLQLRAANGKRPIIRLLDWQTDAPDDLVVTGAAESWFVLDGIVVTGRGMQVGGNVSGVTIRHCTLVPGWGLECDCGPKRPSETSLGVGGAPLCITIERSIIGAIQVERDEAKEEPLQLRISDSVLDATGRERTALGAYGKLCAYATLSLRRSTVFGQIQAYMIELAEDSILSGVTLACRRQQGCMRFCYVAPGSRTPRRYECQPDLVEQAIAGLFAKGDVNAAEHDALLAAERLRVEPQFDSTRYGTPTYARLATGGAVEIAAGADDGSEMGVFHDLYQPLRAGNLRRRLDEYTPAGTDAGIIYAS